tara:strand:+ start:370 stop:693 length:324 start_codon:yes stop_codon:yes gene_type:complete
MEMTIDKAQKKASLVSTIMGSVWLLLTIVAIAILFYATTNSTLSKHTEQIDEIKTDVGSIKDEFRKTSIDQSVSAAVIKNLEDKINCVDNKVDKMDDKLDKILMQTK